MEGGGAGRAKSDETTEDAPAETWILHLHIGYPSQSTFKCPICDAYYNTLASLRRHIKTSHSDYTLNEVLVCDTCGEESTTVKGIKSHQKSTHGGVLPPPPIPHSAFPCPHSELSFPSKLSCSQHVRGRHMDEACQTRAKADDYLSDGKRKAWNQVEVDKFKSALLQFGPLSNVAIANAIGTRTCKQVGVFKVCVESLHTHSPSCPTAVNSNSNLNLNSAAISSSAVRQSNVCQSPTPKTASLPPSSPSPPFNVSSPSSAYTVSPPSPKAVSASPSSPSLHLNVSPLPLHVQSLHYPRPLPLISMFHLHLRCPPIHSIFPLLMSLLLNLLLHPHTPTLPVLTIRTQRSHPSPLHTLPHQRRTQMTS